VWLQDRKRAGDEPSWHVESPQRSHAAQRMTKLVVVAYRKAGGDEDASQQTQNDDDDAAASEGGARLDQHVVVDVRRVSEGFTEEEEKAVILEGIKKLPEELQSEELLSSTLAAIAKKPAAVDGKPKLGTKSSSRASISSSASLGAMPKKPKRLEKRVRSTLEMSSFLLSQAQKYDLFEIGTLAKRDKKAMTRDWERSRLEFNLRFKTDVDLAAYKRKIVHLKKGTGTYDGALTTASAGASSTKFSSKTGVDRSEDTENSSENESSSSD